jgi:hypothetical protein
LSVEEVHPVLLIADAVDGRPVSIPPYQVMPPTGRDDFRVDDGAVVPFPFVATSVDTPNET